jgi:hypothetical protein
MPDRYILILEVDVPAVALMLASGRRLALAKHHPGGSAQVAWIALEPTGSDTIAWEETYGLYAATSALATGRVIGITAALPRTIDRAVYPFVDGSFGAAVPDEHVPPGHRDVRNQAPVAVAFGLLQTAIVNGRPYTSPVNAVTVPADGTADFTGLTALSIWQQTGIESGSISTLPESCTTISFTPERRVVRCSFNSSQSRFVPSTCSSPRRSERRPRPPLTQSSPANDTRDDNRRRKEKRCPGTARSA